MTSELLRVPGIGEAKRRQLLEAFGSLQGVRDASAADIAALPGFGQTTAERILEALRRSAPIPAPAAGSAESVVNEQSAAAAADPSTTSS